ncbi:MAG: ABC transporter ATP-binding protein [Bryobacteraceae bacterium]
MVFPLTPKLTAISISRSIQLELQLPGSSARLYPALDKLSPRAIPSLVGSRLFRRSRSRCGSEALLPSHHSQRQKDKDPRSPHTKYLRMIDVRSVTKVIENGVNRVDPSASICTCPAVNLRQSWALRAAAGTLLGIIAGLDAPSSGTIHLNGEEITCLSEDRLAVLRGRTVGFVFQSYQLIPTLTAEENVLLPYELIGARSDGSGRVRAQELLAQVGLGERRHHYPVQLSGGEQQRVALARAFMVRPPILLADEPTGNLDSVNGRHVLELLIELNAREGTTLVLVTHDQQLAAQARRMITLQDGQIVSDELR